MNNFGEELALQFKLMKHIKDLNISRIRDYIIYIRVHYPNLDKCNIDTNILKRAIDILRYNGYVLDLQSDHSDNKNLYILKPDLHDDLITSIVYQDLEKMRITLIRLRNHYPNMESSNADKTILKICIDTLRHNKYEIHLGEDHKDNPDKYIVKIKE